MTTNHGLCYCEGPFIGQELPKFLRDRAHIARPNCGVTRLVTRQPEWMQRKNRGLLRAKELTY